MRYLEKLLFEKSSDEYSLLPTTYSLLPTPYVLASTSYSLLPTPYVLASTSYSLHPTSYCRLPTFLLPTPFLPESLAMNQERVQGIHVAPAC